MRSFHGCRGGGVTICKVKRPAFIWGTLCFVQSNVPSTYGPYEVSHVSLASPREPPNGRADGGRSTEVNHNPEALVPVESGEQVLNVRIMVVGYLRGLVL